MCSVVLSGSGQVFPANGGSWNPHHHRAAGMRVEHIGHSQRRDIYESRLRELEMAPSPSRSPRLRAPSDRPPSRLAASPSSSNSRLLRSRGLSLAGSIPQLASEQDWGTAFTLVNKSASSIQTRLNLLSEAGGPLTLPLTFPQQPPLSEPLLAASIDRTLAAHALLVINANGLRTSPLQIGSAQLGATGSVDGFAIFHLLPGAQEAVVPLETRNASSYWLAYDQTGGVVVGVALANASTQPASVAFVIRDDSGAQIGSGVLPSLAGGGHTSFVLAAQFPVTASKRGSIEFDTPAGGQMSVVGIRTTLSALPFALTTIPPLANVGAAGGLIPHVATGSGWQTTFVMVNMGATAALTPLQFFGDNGSPLSLPIGFPQSGGDTNTLASSVDRTLAAGATLIVQSAGPGTDLAPTTGSANSLPPAISGGT